MSVTVCRSLSQCVAGCHSLSQAVIVCRRLSQSVAGCHSLSQAVTDCHAGLENPGLQGATQGAKTEAPKITDVPEHISRMFNWKRILLLIVAITVHNIPEGLAVGVAFGAIGKSTKANFENARNLAFGIGIQNFPEGLAVSLPLRGSGMSVWKCFMYGQLSGLVEPIAGVLGALAVSFAEPILPYALAFAAGAMIYVVIDDIIPEAQTCGNSTLASCGTRIKLRETGLHNQNGPRTAGMRLSAASGSLAVRQLSGSVIVFTLGPSGAGPSGEDPVRQEPVGEDPVGQDPVGQDPVGSRDL
ncbi:hypothetical protein LSAT2_005474 [Lamellibrachia satsuma]|nr:hypothetical protein LSAT2_005474 [Lamellibrachia satsuma]